MLKQWDWTRVEEFVLKNAWGVEDMATIRSRLPERSEGAIRKRAAILGLNTKTQEQPTMNTFAKTKSIEQLEAELTLKKAETELEAARQRLAIFNEQCFGTFSQAMKSDGVTLNDLFKQNATTFSKLNGAISNANRRLLEARIKLTLV